MAATMNDDGSVNNIRELLGFLIGKRVVDVLQHDSEEWDEDRACFVEFCFENGARVRMSIGDEPMVIATEEDD